MRLTKRSRITRELVDGGGWAGDPLNRRPVDTNQVFAATMVAAWIRAETGVGRDISVGGFDSQLRGATMRASHCQPVGED